jgi:hypothetical protein
MDLNNDKYLNFREFSTILMGSMRADFRLRALFSFYVYDEGQKGLINHYPVMFFCIHEVSGHLGAEDLHRIVILCNKCAEAGGKKTRSDKRVSLKASQSSCVFVQSTLSQTQSILKTLVENKILENVEEVSANLGSG